MKIDVQEWKGKIAAKDFNKSSYSNLLGISRETLNGYFKDPDKTPYKVIKKSVVLLGLSEEDTRKVFFAE